MNTETVTAALAARDDAYTPQLRRIGQAIGYGNAQSILGRLWDEMLTECYGVPPGRGKMGVTVDDALPPIPKAAHKRRSQMSHGGYEMVPAYTVADLKQFAHAAMSPLEAKIEALRAQLDKAADDMIAYGDARAAVARDERTKEWADHMARMAVACK